MERPLIVVMTIVPLLRLTSFVFVMEFCVSVVYTTTNCTILITLILNFCLMGFFHRAKAEKIKREHGGREENKRGGISFDQLWFYKNRCVHTRIS